MKYRYELYMDKYIVPFIYDIDCSPKCFFNNINMEGKENCTSTIDEVFCLNIELHVYPFEILQVAKKKDIKSLSKFLKKLSH